MNTLLLLSSLFLAAIPLQAANIPAEFIIPSREVESPSRLRDMLDGLKARFQSKTSQKQRPKRPYNDGRRKWLLGGTVGLATAGAIIAYRTLVRDTTFPQGADLDNGTSDGEGDSPMDPLDWTIQDARKNGLIGTLKRSVRSLRGSLRRAFSGSQKQPTPNPRHRPALNVDTFSPFSSGNPYDDLNETC